LLLQALNIPEPAPEFMLGSLASVPLPDWSGPKPEHIGVWWHPFQKQLLQKHRIEVPVMVFPDFPRQLIRIAAQLYNTLDQYSRLAEVLRHERP
jgi:isopenicillin-N epimerase